MSRNGVKYWWTESNLRLFIWVLTEPPLDAFRLLVRSEHINLSDRYLSEVTYKHTWICDCKFSKHDGLETYIVPGQMLHYIGKLSLQVSSNNLHDRCSLTGTCISFLFGSGTSNVSQWPTYNKICYELTAFYVHSNSIFVILMEIINMISFCAMKCHSRKCPTAW